MTVEIILEHGTVVDGTGAPSVAADVAISDGRIVAIGALDGLDALERIDCCNRVVSPGFIDVHTQYDAQVLWDPALTPSSWYGVTTVLAGNCGFSLAPTERRERVMCLRTFEAVEAMPVEVLQAGITWSFETFEEYLAHVRSLPLRVNMAHLVGHSMLRSYVMGDDARERTASPDEIAAMCRVLDAALAAGASGLSTSRSRTHVAGGRPVASRLADLSEIAALADVIGSKGGGLLQANRGPGLDIAELGALSDRIGRPITWTSLHSTPDTAGARRFLAETERWQESGVALWPQMSWMPITVDFTFAEPYVLLEQLPSFDALSGADRETRIERLRDPSWRRAVEADMTLDDRRRDLFAPDRIAVLHSASAPDLEGRTLADLADDRGVSPLDAIADMLLADRLNTRFTIAVAEFEPDVTSEFLRHSSILLGLSDTGAHASQMCGASFACELLGTWVRDRKVLSLEEGIRKLTGQPADVLGLTDRGRVATGAWADICVFDPATIAHGPTRRVRDQPAGGDRLVRNAVGIEHVLVNGEPVIRSGESLAVSGPGRLLPLPQT